jgi:two-component system NtrC family sensor kinase
MSQLHIFLILSDPTTANLLENEILRPAGYEITQLSDRRTLDILLESNPPDLLIVSDKIPEGSCVDLAAELATTGAVFPIILCSDPYSELLALQALRRGFSDYLFPPFDRQEVLEAVQTSLDRYKRLRHKSSQHAEANLASLNKKLEGLEAMQRIGRKVTSILELDNVLSAVVDAAVELTGAEEGSLLLIDENSGELYMRAARNFREDFVRTFRMPIKDTLPGEVLRTGQSLLLNTATPKKIKTSYLVHTVMYVPMLVGNRVIGVLGVDNRRSGHPFSDYHLDLVAALADYAAIAVENARLYASSEIERGKLNALLTQIQDGVIVLDHDRRLIMINQAAQSAFGLSDPIPVGKAIRDLIQNIDLLEIINRDNNSAPYRGEIPLEDGRVFSAQVTPVAEVGLVLIMQDITYLKELDRIKSDFVSTVSHDLRSPLTAILGYVELLGRVGSLNAQQQEFINRIQASVESITSLINDLLDLGRIEAGFDARKEIVPLSALLRYTVESMSAQAERSGQTLEMEIPEALPPVIGNPVRLRQMVENLIGNSLAYTPQGGKIQVSARAEGDQVLLEVSDNGPGIPPSDQPYIFDKFYRAGNVPSQVPGAGLGLAIVKSIVENHQGRIWVDSTLGEGTRFSIILPVSDLEL